MKSKIEIKFRKERIGPELDLVNNFLEYYKELFIFQNLELTPLIEPYAEIGVPDVLLIAWDKNLCENWVPARNNLTKTDIKIIHHVSSFGKRGVDISKVAELLNFSSKTVFHSLDRLAKADLVEKSSTKVNIKDLDEKFFIRKIISIEAKIDNWKGAIYQAQLNENFSSHSYVLLPDRKLNKSVLSSFTGKTGLLTHDGKKTVFRKRAQETKIPGSYFSWVLNEYLGRQQALNSSIQ